MSISYQFGDVDAHGALIRSQAASLEAEHQSIVRDVLAAEPKLAQTSASEGWCARPELNRRPPA